VKTSRAVMSPLTAGRAPAAGLLIVTTASDSDGTLGGLVHQSEPARLERIVATALGRATRCSSDPICAKRTPKDPEDFLHGAACHCCVMASETSCERANASLTGGSSVVFPGTNLASSVTSADTVLVADQDSGWRFGQFLTGTEAREIADHLADGDTLTAAVRVLAPGRRPQARALLEAANRGSPTWDAVILMLRAIAGARSAPTSIDPALDYARSPSPARSADQLSPVSRGQCPALRHLLDI
jgi:hypothetical protein